MKFFTIAAALLIASPAQAQPNTRWAHVAGQIACNQIRRGATSETAFNAGMQHVLDTPALRAEFVKFAASKGEFAQMNSEGALYRGFYAACPEHNPVRFL